MSKDTITVDRQYLERLEYQHRQRGYTITTLRERIHELELKNEQLDVTIRTELEPRIARERQSYDAYVLTDRSLVAEEDFMDKADEMCDMVQKKPHYFYWDDEDGNLYQQMLSIIKREEERQLNCQKEGK